MYTWPVGDNRVDVWNDCGTGLFGFLSLRASIDTDRSAGVLASFEYVFARRCGAELSMLYWTRIVEINASGTGFDASGRPNFILPMLGFNYHFLTLEKADLFAGPVFGLGITVTGAPVLDMELGSDVALGINVGIDYSLDDSWSLGGNIRYLDFGTVDFSFLPPGIGGIFCNNGVVGIGSMNFLSLTLGVGFKI